MKTEEEIQKRYEKEKYLYKQACKHHLLCTVQQCEGALNTLEWVLKDGE